MRADVYCCSGCGLVGVPHKDSSKPENWTSGHVYSAKTSFTFDVCEACAEPSKLAAILDKELKKSFAKIQEEKQAWETKEADRIFRVAQNFFGGEARCAECGRLDCFTKHNCRNPF